MTPKAPIERRAFSISEFCARNGISRSFYYQLPPDEKPRETRKGGRVLITDEAEREWLGMAVPA